MTKLLNAHGRELPAPDDDALAHSRRVTEAIKAAIAAADGALPFSRYMDMALYAPGLGYYSAGARKLGAEGDFITAPELSPLFGQVLARAAQALFKQSGLPAQVLEVGAGSGALAASMLEELMRLDAVPEQYFILELSADLRQRERDTLAARVPDLLERVVWLNQLPPEFSGLIIGNEVLDAMPVELFRAGASGIEQGIVVTDSSGFALQWRPASRELAEQVEGLRLAAGYQSEIGLAAAAFILSLADVMGRSVALFIDYGFPGTEFYHAQRSSGTLMCHYRHRAHGDPFFLPGLQDITAHVDFSAIAAAAHAGGLEVLGYASQANFLVNCGITEVLSRLDPNDAANYLPASNAAQRLLSPAEMGELFKVIALGRGVDEMPLGFANGDRTHTL
jgi:SAM-dependent MidA family methyltransferase